MTKFAQIVVYAVIRTFLANYDKALKLILDLANNEKLKGDEKRKIVIAFLLQESKGMMQLIAELLVSALLIYAKNNNLIEYDSSNKLVAVITGDKNE